MHLDELPARGYRSGRARQRLGAGNSGIEKWFAPMLLDLPLIYASDKSFNPALESTPSQTCYHEPLTGNIHLALYNKYLTKSVENLLWSWDLSFLHGMSPKQSSWCHVGWWFEVVRMWCLDHFFLS